MNFYESIFRKGNHTCVITIIAIVLGNINFVFGQCDPSTINLCDIGNNNIIQAAFHAQIAKTSDGYSITGQDFAPNGTDYSVVLSNIPSAIYPMPTEVVPVWGAMGGRTQAVFLASDSRIYAVGEEDLLIDEVRTSSPAWGVTTLTLPPGMTVCDVNKWQGAAGSGSGNDMGNSNATGERDGFLVFSTYDGKAYITGDGAKAIQDGASNSNWTLLNMPENVSVVNFGVGYRTLLVLGSDGNLYASGVQTYLGDGTSVNTSELILLQEQPSISVFGISQIEAGFHSYFVLDADGTIHVLGENSEGGLGVGNKLETTFWSKVGQECPGGILNNVAYISTMSTHDHHISSSAILVDGTIRSWGSNNRKSITTGLDMIIPCPITPTGNNKNAVAISNGGHISPYVNTNVQICNIGHNRQGAFGDGNDEQGDYGEYKCNIIPGFPEICGTKESNLALEKSVNTISPQTGQDIVFTITVSNLGPEPSTGSFVRDLLSTAFYYLSDDSNGDYNPNTGLWKVGPLEVGESRSLNITVKVIMPGVHTNYAQILVDYEVDVNSTPGNNSSNEDDDGSVGLNVLPCPITELHTLLCPGDSIIIDSNWVNKSGQFVETIPLPSGCDSLIITHVRYVEDPPIPQLDIDCESFIYQLSIDPSSVWLPNWDNGDMDYETVYFDPVNGAKLTLEASPDCAEEVIIDLPVLAQADDLPTFSDTTIQEYTQLEIDLDLDDEEWKILWDPATLVDCDSCMNVRISADVSSRIKLFLEHVSGCTYEASFDLTVEKVPTQIYVPNVFSPNSDFANSEWTVFTTPNVIIESCSIYDRWGNMVFNSSDQELKWDGRKYGEECSQGVYVYIIKYKKSNQETKEMLGDITLLR